ncbi:unnamed protein product [Lymnaea stagnalis]|uniref:RING-type domain-containing protein n=1 Tax=Lymnaea stagnalis TaxID=6523 RepID=A0AAV2HSH5_LYMST
MAYNLDRNPLGATSSDSLTQRDSTEKLLESISGLERAKMESLFSSYKSVIKAVLSVSEDLPASFIFYCADKMVNEGKEISSQALLVECDNLLDMIPENSLLQIINNIGDITISSLEASEISNLTISNISGAENPRSSSSDEACFQDTARCSSADGGNAFKIQANTTVKNVVSNNVNLVDGVDSAHVRSTPVYEDEVDRISLTSFPNYQSLDPGSSATGKGGVVGAVGLFGLVHPPLKTQTKNTAADLLVQGDGSRSLDSKQCLMAVTRENEFLETRLQCVLCKARPRATTFLPCGHFLVCGPCSTDIYVCSMCHAHVLGEVTTRTVSHIDRNP